MAIDYNQFFARKSYEVARDLVGRLLSRETETGTTSGRIIEVGAYEGGNQTKSRAGMNYAPGTLFLMTFRGHHLLNIATDRVGFPSCVEIRAVAFHDGVIKGAAKVANYFSMKDLDGIVLGGEVKIIGEGIDESHVMKVESSGDNCLGYFLMK